MKKFLNSIENIYDSSKEIFDSIKKYIKKLHDSPYAGIIYLLLVSVIAALISFAVSKIPDKAETENESLLEAAATIETTTTSQAPETTSIEETTTQEETTTAELIDISQLEISNKDLSEPTHRDNTVSNNDAPAITPTTTVNFSPNNYTSVIYGIDVSKWQGDIDWNQVAAAGYKFVFIKVGGRGTSGGSLYYDDKFRENIEGASRAGLNVGVYFFSQAITDREALEEASLIIDAIKGYNITYPVVFDWETGWFSNGRPYRANNANLSKAAMTSIVNTFINTVESHGYEAMVYGNLYDLTLFDVASVAATHKIWYARYWNYYRKNDNYYIPGNQTPETPFPYDIWQYKDTGIVPGISEKVDMNVQFISNNIQINVPNNIINTELGVNIDLLKNVTAKNGKGKDISSTLSYKIKNSQGTEVTLQNALNKAGTYTVIYTATDLGMSYSKDDVTLTVISKPVITLSKSNATYFILNGESVVSTEELLEALNTAIDENLISAKSYNGENLKDKVTIDIPNDLSLLSVGKYTITYTVKDSNNIVGSAVLNISIVNTINDVVYIPLDEATSSTFRNALNTLLITNLSESNLSNVSIIYSDELVAAIQSKTFNVDDTFTIKYKTSDFENDNYYLSCNIKITEPEEATTVPEETSTDDSSTTSEETTSEETTSNENI